MFRKLEGASEHLEVLVKPRFLASPKKSDSVGLGWGSRTDYISNKGPRDADAPGLGSNNENQCTRFLH